MKSYLWVNRVEGRTVFCKVHNTSLAEDGKCNEVVPNVVEINLRLECVEESVGGVAQGDVLEVEYEADGVQTIYGKSASGKEN